MENLQVFLSAKHREIFRDCQPPSSRLPRSHNPLGECCEKYHDPPLTTTSREFVFIGVQEHPLQEWLSALIDPPTKRMQVFLKQHFTRILPVICRGYVSKRVVMSPVLTSIRKEE